MNGSIDKYLNRSKKNLSTILINLETNIEFLDNRLWSNSDEFKELINKIINIYYDKYYLYDSNDFSIINKYIKFNNNINRKLKTILLAIIEYYENNNMKHIIVEQESSILYLDILIYLGITLYNTNFYLIDDSKKIEKVINNIIDNFQSIRFKKTKDLVLLISNIKDIVSENNKFMNIIDNLNSDISHNYFIKINRKDKYYKVIYEYNIESLNEFDERDINIVNNKMKISNMFTGISYDLLYYNVFKLLSDGILNNFLFKVRKEDLMNNDTLNYLTRRSNIINKHIKFLLNYDEIQGDYDFINLMKSKDIDIVIEVNKVFETNNYNMFMYIKNIVVDEEFLNTNEKYMEIWKDMNMNFIIKNLSNRLKLKDLFNRK